MRLNHNMFSLSAYRTYSKNMVQNSTALERISTGSKLNASKDNPKKIGESSIIRIQLKSLESSTRNVQDGISMIQTAESGLNEISSMLQRMRTLTVQAGNETYSDDDRQKMQDEIEELKEGINDIANNTTFNGVRMLGANVKDSNTYVAGQSASSENILIGYLSNERMNISYFNVSCNYLKDENGVALSDIKVTSLAEADKAYSVIDSAISTIAKIRSEYGAQSQRLESTADHIDANSILMNTAESNIVDADMAEEIMEYSRTDILRQAAIGIIKQTNEIPMNALQILRNSAR